MKETILYRYQTHQSTKDEMIKVKQWLSESQENRNLFNQIKKISETAARSEPSITINIDQAWYHLVNRLEQWERSDNINASHKDQVGLDVPRMEIMSAWKSMRKFGMLASVAALILISTGIGYMTYYATYHAQLWSKTSYENVSESNVYRTDYGEKKHFVLPDETKVTLRAGSQLLLESDFDEEVRNVRLQGEAYFQVDSKNKLPFEVFTNEAKIKVYGTSFNVGSWQEKKQTEVVVTSGSVGVVSIDDNENIYTTINKSDRAVISGGSSRIYVDKNDINNYLCWIEDKICFYETPLRYAFKKIEREYDVTVVIEPGMEYIKDEKITAQYKNETMHEIMEIMAFTHQIKYEFYNDNKIEIKAP